MNGSLILYFNVSEDDKKAFLLLKSSSIPCGFRCPASCLEGTPLLLDGYTKYVGLNEIESFVENSSNKTLGKSINEQTAK